MSIVVNNLSYALPDGTSIFSNISFSIGRQSRCALVGANGCGKSTLMDILIKKLAPGGGEMFLSDSPYLVPQHYGQYDSLTVAEALGVDRKLTALHSIISGDASEENFILLEDDWSVEERVRSALDFWGLNHVTPDTAMSSLSGGEKTEVFLSGISIYNPEIILLDEPTNHLDEDARTKLYGFMETVPATVLAVSHDRIFLNRFSEFYELSDKGLRLYHGSFEEYLAAVENENLALVRHADCLRKELRKEKMIAREVAERQQRHNSRGQRHSEKKCVARIAMGNLKNKAENSTARLAGSHQVKIERLSDSVSEAYSAIRDIKKMVVDFSSSDLHAGKVLLEAHGVNHGFGNGKFLWYEPLDFTIRSGDRIRVTGSNGSGKSTLMKIITGDLIPVCGSVVKSGNLRHAYLDQDYSLIDDSLSVSGQILRYNHSSLPEHELNTRLNRFLFPKSAWDKPCAALSGGEKMRLSLCCLMVADNAPDIIIADEPTNNLDLYNTEVLVDTLNSYSGTLIVISHDTSFINRLSLGIELSL